MQDMLTVNKLLPGGQGLAQVLLKRAPSVELDWDVRQKSRFDATDSSGRHLGVFLPRGTLVRGGDVLIAEDGSMVRVLAAPQPVLVVRPCSEHGTPFDLVRAAYHLGNRHVQLELQPDHLKFEPDTCWPTCCARCTSPSPKRSPPSSPRAAPMPRAGTATGMAVTTTTTTAMRTPWRRSPPPCAASR